MAGRYLKAATAEISDLCVSILAQPNGRALPVALGNSGSAVRVSILAQPNGRALPGKVDPLAINDSFQSSPSRMAGRYQRHGITQDQSICFNPRPAEWPGATGSNLGATLASQVSILAQPNGRALRICFNSSGLRFKFQSSPSRMAGRYLNGSSLGTPYSCFNPRPAEWPGATTRGLGGRDSTGSFNPRPAEWPGATSVSATIGEALPVSILAQPNGRALHCLPGHAALWHVRFNPRPAEWPGATQQSANST
ncbi:hypothetical protein SAMN05421881_100530 [Nitrosomonas halophila]|uniref:Uncharacterized protein n=1 Tax=Nitrosomonas halophila TaxID=44576 RepID=A0A1H3DGN7_9PROT|nr:hypothetical protein SAMN05421881_100530 [Nitrosomonas halophila]